MLAQDTRREKPRNELLVLLRGILVMLILVRGIMVMLIVLLHHVYAQPFFRYPSLSPPSLQTREKKYNARGKGGERNKAGAGLW